MIYRYHFLEPFRLWLSVVTPNFTRIGSFRASYPVPHPQLFEMKKFAVDMMQGKECGFG
jgi:hypothetical protein